MSSLPNPDLVKVTDLFLIPSSFLVAALGTADTNVHRAMVSALGLAVSVMWWVCSREALAEHLAPGAESGPPNLSRRLRILAWLPVFFAVTWTLSLVIHLMMWNQPLGH